MVAEVTGSSTTIDVDVVVVSGAASGPIVVLDEPLSFWGGFDSETGRIIDQHHPQAGTSLQGAVVVVRSGRGSSSASSVIAEAARRGTGPAALIMRESDEIIATGAIVADELYGHSLPVVLVDESAWRIVSAATSASVTNGVIELANG